MHVDRTQPYLNTNTPSYTIIEARYNSCIMASKSTKYKGMWGMQGKANGRLDHSKFKKIKVNGLRVLVNRS